MSYSSTPTGATGGIFGPSSHYGVGAKNMLNSKFNEKLRQMSTPGWQMLKRIIIFISLIGVFGIIYHFVIKNNPEEWSHPTDENDNSIINGFYVSTVVNSTVGYGDYYPYSQRGIILVVFNILLSWILFSTILG